MGIAGRGGDFGAAGCGQRWQNAMAERDVWTPTVHTFARGWKGIAACSRAACSRVADLARWMASAGGKESRRAHARMERNRGVLACGVLACGGWRPRMERIAACSRADGKESRRARVRRIWRGGWRPRMERIAACSRAEGNESRRARGGQNRDVRGRCGREDGGVICVRSWRGGSRSRETEQELCTPTLTSYRVVEI
jgi:hypothetical protein